MINILVNLNALLNRISKDINELDFEKLDVQELFRNINESHINKIPYYSKIYDYYKGDTDAKIKYSAKLKDAKTDLFTNVNYFKKFVKEEVSYAIGNPITLEGLDDDSDIVDLYEEKTYHWDENHDSDLMKYLVIFTRVYELYYRDKEGRFSSRIIKPLNGYAYRNFDGDILFFVHMHTSQFEEDVEVNGVIETRYRTYYDVYTDKYIYRFDDSYNLIPNENGDTKTLHKFDEVPVSVGVLTKEDYKDSLYGDTKGLQDALETNLSDMGNEISDYRNAFLAFIGCDVENKDLATFNELGAIKVPKASGKEDVKWLIKEINDTFMQNTLDRYIDLLYQNTNHINHNEKLQSNLSSLTLRNRLNILEQKCDLNISSHKDMIKNRMRFFCKYLNATELDASKYDYKQVKITYTPNIPQDDLMMAQIVSQLDDGIISKATAMTLFSFIKNPKAERERIDKELKASNDLLKDEYINDEEVVEDE